MTTNLRNCIRRCGGLLALLSGIGVAPAINAQPAAPPNIVVILADDLGIGDLGYNGQLARAANGLPAISTPNIDSLAASGVSFSNMYAAPICSPSRASLLTGFHQGHALIEQVSHAFQLRKEETTWGEVLKTAGYSTGMYGKWHVGGVFGTTITNFDALPTQQGFDQAFGTMSGGYRNAKMWESDGAGSLRLINAVPDPTWTGPGVVGGPYEYTDDSVANRATQYIRTAAMGSQPFAAYVALQGVHEPYDHLPINALYAGKSWTDSQKRYASMVTRMDQHVGQVLNAINDPNGDGNAVDSEADNTIVIFTSDNGPLWPAGGDNPFNPEFFNSNGPYTAHKASTLEGGIRVPFLVRWQGVTTPGTVNGSFTGSLTDVLPTIADLVDRETPLGIDGRSILPEILGQGNAEPADAMVWSHPSNFSSFDLHGWSVRVGDWKLTKRESGIKLNNLAVDPYETTNLAVQRADIATALQTIAFDEGLGREPNAPHKDFPTISITVNNWFTQFKSWSPQASSTNFAQASNWSGGTSTAGSQSGLNGTAPAQNWNTGPADNWIATVANATGGSSVATISTDTKVLALEVKATLGTMTVALAPAVDLDARNGIRIRSAGTLRLNGGVIRTTKQLDIRSGGSFVGAGNITGWQNVIAGIPEFQGQGLFAPEVVNAGTVDIRNGSAAGLLAIDGDFQQQSTGQLLVDLFSAGSVGGVNFDKLSITGDATLAGGLQVQLAGAFKPVAGQSFAILSAASIVASDLKLIGPQANFFSLAVLGGSQLAVSYMSADFDGNGFVNQLDLATWRQNFGSIAGGAGDANGDGKVDGFDFGVWQRQLGAVPASLLNAVSVPEPTSFCLGLILTAVGIQTGRRHRTSGRHKVGVRAA